MTGAPVDVDALAAGLDRLTLWLRRQSTPQVSSTTITALDTLRSAGAMRVSELARREAISQPGMTVLVNRLEGGGYAERVPDATDGRATLVQITDAGRGLLAERHAQRARLLADRLALLTGVDQQALHQALPAIEHLTDDEADIAADRAATIAKDIA